MKKIMITGYNSSIAKELIRTISEKQKNVEVVRCGRCNNADIKVDFSVLEEVRSFCQIIESSPPDYLFINHGVLIGDKVMNINSKTITESLNVNLVSVAMLLESLSKIDYLSTIVMSSISGKVGSYDTLYSASKAGVDVLVKSFSLSLPLNSRLNAVSPGIIEDAKMTTVRTDLDILELKKNKTPSRQFTNSKDVSGLVYYVLFQSKNMLGENINLNGGMYVK